MRALFFLSLITFSLSACPFANFQRGRFQSEAVAIEPPRATAKDILNQMHQRYAIALEEMQYQCAYDYIEFKHKIATLEGFVKKAESYPERRAIIKTARALKLILDKDFKMHLTGRDRYRDFLDTMRQAIDHKNHASWKDIGMQQFISEILQHISFSHFTINFNQTPIGYKYFWQIMPENLMQIDACNLNAKVLNKTVNKMLPLSTPHVLMSYLKRKIHGFFFASWDGALSTMRAKMATYQWHERQVALLRMSCPIYGKNYSSKIDPLFTEYLKSLQRQNKKHLYIGNLDATANTFSKSFKVNKLLQKLSKPPNFSDSFLFIVLPVESAFYKQGNLGLLRASYFKETFLNSMLTKQEGFYFPSQLLKDSKFVAFLGHMLDDIHLSFFENHEFLERNERCQFIDIAYAHIAKYLIEENQVSFVSWTGSDGVDQSMGAVAILDVLLQSITPAPIHLDSTLYISLWPALVHYHRHPRTSCTIRSHLAIQKLLEKKQALPCIQETVEDVLDLEL